MSLFLCLISHVFCSIIKYALVFWYLSSNTGGTLATKTEIVVLTSHLVWEYFIITHSFEAHCSSHDVEVNVVKISQNKYKIRRCGSHGGCFKFIKSVVIIPTRDVTKALKMWSSKLCCSVDCIRRVTLIAGRGKTVLLQGIKKDSEGKDHKEMI